MLSPFVFILALPPMPSAEEFKQIQAFSRKMGLAVPAEPLPEKLNAAPALQALDPAKAEAELKRAFFVDGRFGDSITIVADTHLALSVVWKSALDAQGKNHLKPRSPEDLEQAKAFGRGQTRNGEWRDELATDGEEIVKVVGAATAEITSKVAVTSLSCAQPGQKGAFGAFTVTLLECKGSHVKLRYDGVPIEGELPDESALVLSNAAGARLAVGEMQSQALFAGGKTIPEISYEDFKKGPTSTRIFEALANGVVSKVSLHKVEKVEKRTFEVIANFEPKGDSPVDVPIARYVAKPAAAQTFAKLDLARLKSETKAVGGRVSAMFVFNQPKVYVTLPQVDNSGFAKLELDKVKPTLKKKEKWTLEVNGYQERLRRHSFTISSEKPIDASKVSGLIKLSYPLSVRAVSVDTKVPSKDGVTVAFEKNQARVKLDGGEAAQVHGFDASGRELRVLPFSSSDGESTTYAFWGMPTRIDVVLTEDWQELKLPFDVKVPPPLKDDMKGRPDD